MSFCLRWTMFYHLGQSFPQECKHFIFASHCYRRRKICFACQLKNGKKRTVVITKWETSASVKARFYQQRSLLFMSGRFWMEASITGVWNLDGPSVQMPIASSLIGEMKHYVDKRKRYYSPSWQCKSVL